MDFVEGHPFESYVPLIYRVPAPNTNQLTSWLENFNDTRFVQFFNVTRQILNRLRPSATSRAYRDAEPLTFYGQIPFRHSHAITSEYYYW